PLSLVASSAQSSSGSAQGLLSPVLVHAKLAMFCESISVFFGTPKPKRTSRHHLACPQCKTWLPIPSPSAHALRVLSRFARFLAGNSDPQLRLAALPPGSSSAVHGN